MVAEILQFHVGNLYWTEQTDKHLDMDEARGHVRHAEGGQDEGPLYNAIRYYMTKLILV